MLLEPLKEIGWAYRLHYYICFRTHRRREAFDSQSRRDFVSRTLREVCSNHDYHLLKHKLYSDHLRCLLSLKPDQARSKVVDRLKSNVSREFNSEYGVKPPLWATGYLGLSVGRVNIEVVKQYIASQSEHHGYSNRVRPPVFRYRDAQPVRLAAAHSVFDLNHHIVLATRYRQSVFDSTVGRNLVSYWRRVAEKREFAIDDVSVPPDHLHLMVRIMPKMSIEECALSLMNNCQDWMAKNCSRYLIEAGVDMLWQPSAYAGTCGKATTAMVKSFLGS